jgi:putative phosphoesterase
MTGKPTESEIEVTRMGGHARVHVAIISDTHAKLDPRVADAVAGHDCVVHAGDVGGAGVLEALRPKRSIVVAVRGNNDVASKWSASEHRALDSLPSAAMLHLPGGIIAVVHGHLAGRPGARHERLREFFPEARIVVFGHSHRRCVDRGERPWVVNPGAAGRARAYGGPGLLSLTATAGRWSLRSMVFDRL